MNSKSTSSYFNASDLDEETEIPRLSVYAGKFSTEDFSQTPKNSKVAKTDKERENIKKTLLSIYIFNHLTPEKLGDIIDHIYQRDIKSGEIIMNEADPADNFYIVKSGVFEATRTKATKTKELLETYKNRGYFGELALLYNTPRCATIKAMSKAELWVLDGKLFRKMVQRQAFLQREKYEKILKSVSMFNSLKEYDKSKLSDALITQNVKPNKPIIEEGTTSDQLYIIEYGEVNITKSSAKGTKIKFGKSDYFGGEGILKNTATPYSATSINECNLIVIKKDVIKAFLEPYLKDVIKNYDQSMKSHNL